MGFKNIKNLNLAINIFRILMNKKEEITVDKKVAVAEALNCSLGELLEENENN